VDGWSLVDADYAVLCRKHMFPSDNSDLKRAKFTNLDLLFRDRSKSVRNLGQKLAGRGEGAPTVMQMSK